MQLQPLEVRGNYSQKHSPLDQVAYKPHQDLNSKQEDKLTPPISHLDNSYSCFFTLENTLHIIHISPFHTNSPKVFSSEEHLLK